MELDRNLSENGGKQYAFARELNFWLEIFPELVDAVDKRDMETCGTIINGGNKHLFDIGSLLVLFLAILVIL